MSRTKRPARTVPVTPPTDNKSPPTDDVPEEPTDAPVEPGEFAKVFHVGEALDQLAHRVCGIEALAVALDDAMARCPRSDDEAVRRGLARVGVLLAGVVDASVEALAFADESVGKWMRFNARRRDDTSRKTTVVR